MATPSDVAVRTSEPPHLRPLARLGELAGAREVLANLVRKEVKVRYKSSVLGMAWSTLNPILYLAAFTLVFRVVVRNPVPNFPVYLLSGLVAWNLFANSLSVGARSVVDNANLVNKVYFPREVLPLAAVGTAAVDFAIQTAVLLVFMGILRHPFWGLNLILLPLAMVDLLLLTVALVLWISALNVRYRDTQHLVSVLLLIWFWFTPIVYPSGFLVSRHLFGVRLDRLMLLNPVADIVVGFQRALYRTVAPEGTVILLPASLPWLAVLLGAVGVGSLGLLLVTWRAFFRMSGDFAEEL